jgi:hypothetical protein
LRAAKMAAAAGATIARVAVLRNEDLSGATPAMDNRESRQPGGNFALLTTSITGDEPCLPHCSSPSLP